SLAQRSLHAVFAREVLADRERCERFHDFERTTRRRRLAWARCATLLSDAGQSFSVAQHRASRNCRRSAAGTATALVALQHRRPTPMKFSSSGAFVVAWITFASIGCSSEANPTVLAGDGGAIDAPSDIASESVGEDDRTLCEHACARLISCGVQYDGKC